MAAAERGGGGGVEPGVIGRDERLAWKDAKRLVCQVTVEDDKHYSRQTEIWFLINFGNVPKSASPIEVQSKRSTAENTACGIQEGKIQIRKQTEAPVP
jgi:hypothetical protein